MRALFLLVVAVVPATAQNPVVRLSNATHPASNEFQIGDRFEIVITGAADRPVSVRTTMAGRTDWGPVIGWTDARGRWSTTGQFEKSDFGGWGEVWTVGGKQATPTIHFSVSAPCLKGGQMSQFQSGPNTVLNCDTADGRQTFPTPSLADSFRTPDGRLVSGRMLTNQTADQYHAGILQDLVTGGGTKEVGAGGRFGDEAGDLILKLIGVNALSQEETRNVLAIVRAAFEKPENIPQAAKDPSRTLLLLRNLAESTDQENLQKQIQATMLYVAAR